MKPKQKIQFAKETLAPDKRPLSSVVTLLWSMLFIHKNKYELVIQN